MKIRSRQAKTIRHQKTSTSLHLKENFMASLQSNLIKSEPKRIAYSIGMTLITFAALIGSASANSPTKKSFASGLIEGCSKNKPTKTCTCYASKITSRYNDKQLHAIYRQMKLEPASRKMFFLVHSPEMNKCIQRNK